MSRITLLYCLLGFNFIGLGQSCQLILVDSFTGIGIQDVHIFFGDRIAVSDQLGIAELIYVDQSFEIGVSHLSYAQQKKKVFCMDTIRLNASMLMTPEVSIVSKVTKKDLRKFYQRLRRSIKTLARFEGTGVAENTVHHQNQIGEYKSFIFNYRQDDAEIAEVSCVNAFQHIRSDTMRYFENIHRLIESTQLGIKKREYNSLLHDFLFRRETWTFELSANLGNGQLLYKFSKEEEEEVVVEFAQDHLRTISL